MASSLITQNDVFIFRLPDEVLMNICSYITSIQQKMGLEQVSKRFNHVSSDSISWKGVHSLQLMLICDKKEPYDDIFKTACDKDNVNLNGFRIPYDKFPSAIELFLHRTQLRHFTLHFGFGLVDLDFESDISLFHELHVLFNQNRANIKIQSLEIHGNYSPRIDEIYGFKGFFLDLFQSSIPYLQELRYITDQWMQYKSVGSSIWEIIQKCDKLKSFTGEGPYMESDFSALIGKPLTEIVLPKLSFNPQNAHQLVNLINNVSSDGIESLTIPGDNFHYLINYFHGHLTENSRVKLKCLSLTSEAVDCLNTIPPVFPIIERFDVLNVKLLSFKFDDYFDDIASYFNLFYGDPVTRRVTLHNLYISKTEEHFRNDISEMCQNDEIDIDFDEMKPTPYVHLSKGNISYVISNLWSNEDDTGSDEDDADMDEDEDIDSDEDEDRDSENDHMDVEGGSDEKCNQDGLLEIENAGDSTNDDEIVPDVDVEN